MRWEEERYVRLYVRDTLDWLDLPWQGRAVLPLLMRKLDRAGRLDLGSGGIAKACGGIAKLIGLPVEVVEPGLGGLLADGTLVLDETGRTVTMPNFRRAQEARTSDAQRAQESRDRKKDAVADAAKDDPSVTDRHSTSHDVTAVTDRHPSLAVPSLAVPDPIVGVEEGGPGETEPPSAAPAAGPLALEPEEPKKPRARKDRQLSPGALAVLVAIAEHGPDYRSEPALADNLEARLRGVEPALTVDEALDLVRVAAADRFWREEVQLAPDTLFRPKHVRKLRMRSRSAPAFRAPAYHSTRL